MHKLTLALAVSLTLTVAGCKSMPLLAPIAAVITGIATTIDDLSAGLKPPPPPLAPVIEVNPR